MLYFHASAMITLSVGRDYAAQLQRFVDAHPGVPCATSTIGFVETVRACDRIGDCPSLLSDLRAEYAEIAVSAGIRDSAARAPVGLRTLDAIHVASAEAPGAELVALLTYDRRMADAAHSRGLRVECPEPIERATRPSGRGSRASRRTGSRGCRRLRRTRR